MIDFALYAVMMLCLSTAVGAICVYSMQDKIQKCISEKFDAKREHINSLVRVSRYINFTSAKNQSHGNLEDNVCYFIAEEIRKVPTGK
jgi:hypothetical protein